MMKRFLIYLVLVFSVTHAEEIKRPSTVHKVYFKDTQNELNVYHLYGRNDGKTIFILGGIQGDEPGGFLSADLYPNIVLEQGNLIIIPRANFHSIIKNNRGIDGDLNRKFKTKESTDVEGQIVEIIKKYMELSDVFLNLHDGWGFYSDTYIGPGRNPNRFGQSIIADASKYFNGKDTLYLEMVARKVLEKINTKIKNEYHKLHFMNTKTFEQGTEYEEMRTSASYYALTEFGIYAFGIESSKNLETIEEKILYHNYAINEFMDYFGVVPEHPSIMTKLPSLRYLMVEINGKRQILGNNDTLYIEKNEPFQILEIIANVERGLSCDVVSWGTNHDINKSIILRKNDKVLIRKDSDVIGKIEVVVREPLEDLFAFLFEVNGKRKVVLANDSLQVNRGDKLEIFDILTRNGHSEYYKVNIKGFVPPDHGSNPGEDRGHIVDTQNFDWKSYSVNGEGKIYPVVIERDNREVARAFVKIND
ncbi:MAG: hypothetical protein JXQ65_06150 [Candidatus Marinimicrobia bacterium]|nr:hypothetical protein [Candidatus Neomarinimicrobiota bacterium]